MGRRKRTMSEIAEMIDVLHAQVGGSRMNLESLLGIAADCSLKGDHVTATLVFLNLQLAGGDLDIMREVVKRMMSNAHA